MPEALTESFCERCGTRYEFKAPTRLNPLRKTRGLVSGLKNYIMSQDALGDAVGDAMRSEQDALASAQLDAFHDSFSFCIECRQYTCVNCWNDGEGRCRSCAPIPGTDDLAERLRAGLATTALATATDGVAPELTTDEIGWRAGVDAWPLADLDDVRSTAVGPEIELPAPEPEPVAEPEPVLAAFEPEPEPEPEPLPRPILAWDADRDFDLVATPPPAEEPAMAFAAAPDLAFDEPTWAPVTDASLEVEPAAESTVPMTWAEAPDLSLVEAEAETAPPRDAEPTPEPAVAALESTEVDAAAAPEPALVDDTPPAAPQVAAEADRIPIIPVAAPPPVISADDRIAALHQPAEPPADDPVAAARRAQLDLLGLGDSESGAFSDRRRPLAYRSSGASLHPAELAARLAAQQDGPASSPAQTIRASMWDASAREVAGAPSHVGVQNCGGCGLSLSATARFCRRCGTRQAQSA